MNDPTFNSHVLRAIDQAIHEAGLPGLIPIGVATNRLESFELQKRRYTEEQLKADPVVIYLVKAADAVEMRACPISRIPHLAAHYTTVAVNIIPIFSSCEDPHIFPYIEWERTKYSLYRGELENIQNLTHEQMQTHFTYLFWETSTRFITQHGLPTVADVNHWATLIQNRGDLCAREKRELIHICKDYCSPF